MTPLESLLGLRGKTVLLSGANGILGSTYAEHYLAVGLRVAAVDRDVSRLRALAARYPDQLLALKADLTDPKQAKKVVALCLKRFKTIDALHDSCALKPSGYFERLETYDLGTWRRVLGGNLETGLLLTQQVVPHFKKRRRGVLLFTSSIYGIVGADPRIYKGSRFLGRSINTPAAYSASKAAVVGLVRHLAAELAPWNIRVNSLCPGGVSSGQNGTFQKKYSKRVPLGRMARAQELVAPALFLLSDGASYVTGHNLVVDGGLTAW